MHNQDFQSQESSIRVLLIEDNPADARLIHELLRDVAVDLFVAQTLAHGLQQLETNSIPDVVLLDLSLPDSFGLDIITKVKEKEPGIPIIILTGTNNGSLGSQAIQQGAQDYLPKASLDEDILIRTIKHAIERQKIAQQLHEAMAAKARFLSVVSHELRTPLTALKEGVGLVYNGTAGDLNEEQKELLEIAQRNLKRLTQLINDVLDLQKLSANAMTMKIQFNDLNDVIREIKTMMAPVAQAKGLDLVLDLDSNLTPFSFDREKIIQVIINLMNNAIKFTDKGAVTLHTRSGDNYIQVSVQDTGPGIKQKDLGRIFQEFEQLEYGGSRRTGGSGLGLAISKEIVDQHGGKIWAESQPEAGSIFHFVLPIEERRRLMPTLERAHGIA